MATYAVGDIQGCYDALIELLAQCEFNPDRDRLWVAGDIVNRGPRSLDTLQYLYDIQHCVTLVLGNHDLHLLAVASGAVKAKKKDTFTDILAAKNGKQLLEWLRQQFLFHHDDALGYSMVHAGLAPQWSIADAKRLATEVETVLRSDQHKEFFASMYGNQPDQWDDALTGYDRLRVITNFLTRVRTLDAQGRIKADFKSHPNEAPAGQIPWYAHPTRLSEGCKIIFGHWAALLGETNHETVFGLDTGCVWGNRLTAMRLEDGQFFSCACRAYSSDD
ncbi:MAG TPA: symmetrical bis(5'-nucleosyl)-tetraphosphatase [Pseudomonadales bacterium]|nr:symmetrical bis(5'-nucleosyl)-tetraphosphatase [Pseudomonadales bacterium]